MQGYAPCILVLKTRVFLIKRHAHKSRLNAVWKRNLYWKGKCNYHQVPLELTYVK